jgi:hypothetical protein
MPSGGVSSTQLLKQTTYGPDAAAGDKRHKGFWHPPPSTEDAFPLIELTAPRFHPGGGMGVHISSRDPNCRVVSLEYPWIFVLKEVLEEHNEAKQHAIPTGHTNCNATPLTCSNGERVPREVVKQ